MRTRDPGAERARPAEGKEETIDWGKLWRTLLRHRGIVAASVLACVAAAVVLTFVQPPSYKSLATVRVGEEKPGFEILSQMAGVGSLGRMAALTGAASDLQTDIAVLSSRRLAESIADSLDLHVEVPLPRRPRSEVLRVLDAPRATYESEARLERQPDGSFLLQVEDTVAGTTEARVRVGEPFAVGGATLQLLERAGREEQIRVEVEPFRHTVERMRKRMLVVRPDPTARVVNVEFSHGDPEMAAAVPNAAVASFIAYKNQINRLESGSTTEFLEEQSRIYQDALREAEARLQRFSEEAGVVEPTVQATEAVKRTAEMQAERNALALEVQGIRELLAEVDRSAAGTGGTSAYRRLASFPSFFRVEAVSGVLEELTQLESQRAQMLVLHTERSEDVRALDRRIRELEGTLRSTASTYAEGLESQIRSLDVFLGRSVDQMRTIPASRVELLRLGRDQKLLEQVYTLIQTRLKEAEIQGAASPANVELLDVALRPELRSSPRLKIYGGVGLVLGLALGMLGALVREATDRSVVSREDVVLATGGIPVLAEIPRDVAAPRRGVSRLLGLVGWSRRPPEVRRVVARQNPRSPVSEAYRSLRTALSLSDPPHVPRVIVVTSASAEDGKTTVAANLAVVLAQRGERTLLVDADLRLGRMHRLLEVADGPGLAEVLGGAGLDAAIQQVPAGRADAVLQVLTAGASAPDPAELLGSEAMRELLDGLRERFDAVILDAPPLNVVTDAALLGMRADAILLVARAEATDAHDLRRAAETIHDVAPRVSGAVLNDVERDLSPADRRYYTPGVPVGSNGAGASAGNRLARIVPLAHGERRN